MVTTSIAGRLLTLTDPELHQTSDSMLVTVLNAPVRMCGTFWSTIWFNIKTDPNLLQTHTQFVACFVSKYIYIFIHTDILKYT